MKKKKIAIQILRNVNTNRIKKWQKCDAIIWSLKKGQNNNPNTLIVYMNLSIPDFTNIDKKKQI